jgi:hypothetical protein
VSTAGWTHHQGPPPTAGSTRTAYQRQSACGPLRVKEGRVGDPSCYPQSGVARAPQRFTPPSEGLLSLGTPLGGREGRRSSVNFSTTAGWVPVEKTAKVFGNRLLCSEGRG